MFIAIWKTEDKSSDNTVKQFTSIEEIKECIIIDPSIRSLPDAIIEVNDDSLTVANEFMISLEVETL